MLVSSPAAALRHCSPAANAEQYLKQKYSEVRIAVAVSNDGELIELWESPEGSWTLLLRTHHEQLCVIASGYGLPPGAEDSVRICEPTREALREALRALIRSANADGAKLSTAARESARRLFDWTFLRDGYVRLYRSDGE